MLHLRHIHAILYPFKEGVYSMSEMEMAQKIHELRVSQKLTLEQVATEVGVGKSTVRKWETGMIANMRRDKIAALAKALHTTPEYLMGWSHSEHDTPADSTLSTEGQKIAAAFDKATAKEKQMVRLALSEYLNEEEIKPVRIAAFSNDGSAIDFSGADPDAEMPGDFTKGPAIP